VWFYNFLDAHDKLLKLQLGFKSLFSFLETQRTMGKITRDDMEFYAITKRHIRSHEPSEREMRIIRVYQDDIIRICAKPIAEFIWALNCGDMMARADKISRIYKNSKGELQTYCHYANYLLHSYELVTKYHLASDMSDGFEKTLNTVIAFDAVTNTLHHSLAACLQVARAFPITGSVVADARMMNFIVKFDLMDGDILGAKTRLRGYIDGDITPALFTKWYASVALKSESFDDPDVIELINKNRRNLF